MFGLRRTGQWGLALVLCVVFTQHQLHAQQETILCDSFDNGTIQDAGNGHTSYWRPSGKVYESDGKAILHATGRPHSKTTISTPAEKRISFFHQPVTATLENIQIKANDGADIDRTQLRFGFRDDNRWTFRNTVDALMVNIKKNQRLVVAWKVGKKQLDPEAGNQLIATNLDQSHGSVTGLRFTVDGTGKTIKWNLAVMQKDHQSDYHGVIGEIDTQTIKSTWKADDHRAVVSAEVQAFLGENCKNTAVELFIDQVCLSQAKQ